MTMETTDRVRLNRRNHLREIAERIVADAAAHRESQRADVGVSPLLISALREEIDNERQQRRRSL